MRWLGRVAVPVPLSDRRRVDRRDRSRRALAALDPPTWSATTTARSPRALRASRPPIWPPPSSRRTWQRRRSSQRCRAEAGLRGAPEGPAGDSQGPEGAQGGLHRLLRARARNPKPRRAERLAVPKPEADDVVENVRDVMAKPLNLLPPLLVLGLADCLIAESTKIGISVSSVTQAMLTVLILGAGTDAGASRRRRLSRRWRRWRSRSRLWAVPDPAWCARSYVPSTVLLLGRWNWWPSRLAQRHTPEAPVARAAR